MYTNIKVYLGLMLECYDVVYVCVCLCLVLLAKLLPIVHELGEDDHVSERVPITNKQSFTISKVRTHVQSQVKVYHHYQSICMYYIIIDFNN